MHSTDSGTSQQGKHPAHQRIAVVAVHGVGDHKPGATAGDLSRQLQYFYPARFSTFEYTPLEIPVGTGDLPIAPAEPQPAAAARRGLPSGVGSRAAAYAATYPSQEGADIQFTAMALADGQNYRSSYNTVRMRCQARQADGTKADVDLYEVFWSDLSHGGIHGGFAVLTQFVQIFLHIASLGRSAVATVLGALPGQAPPVPGLGLLNVMAAWAYWLLALPIALGNILLLNLGLALLPLLVQSGVPGRLAAATLVGLAVVSLLGLRLKSRLNQPDSPSWLARHGMPVILALGAGSASLLATVEWEAMLAPGKVLFAIVVPILLGLSTLLVDRYNLSRPGAGKWWRRLLLLLAAWALFVLYMVWDTTGISVFLTWYAYLVEGCFALLAAAWLALYVVNLVLFGAACRCKWRAVDDRIGRAADTCLLAATLPAPLLLTVVLAIWTLAWSLLDSANLPVMNTSIGPLFDTMDGSTTLIGRMGELIYLSASDAFFPYLCMLAAGLLCAVIAMLPSLAAELAPPAAPARDDASRGLWRWLNQGFSLLQLAKWLCAVGFVFVLPAGVLLQYVTDWFPGVSPLARYLGSALLLFVALTKLSAFNVLGKVSGFFARLRVLVDTLIDVDNWLRERPVGHTPRLHIMARYTSLLRHLQRQGYDKVVLVCHSQGTVITADVLRYLHAHQSPLLRQLGRIELLTVGCPLRQLYAARFPGIYSWGINPDHAEAGLASWNNGYGSGDYVGRNLWDNGGPDPLWKSGDGAGRREFCVGALAHTRYFTKDAPQVAAAVMGLLES